MPAASDTRLSNMSIDLGGEQVALERIDSMEVLGKPFTLMVDIISPLGEIDLMPHLGKPVGVSVLDDGELIRAFNGVVTEGEYIDESSAGIHYRLTARPFTHFMSQNRDMAIFQDLSALEIIKKVFADAGMTDVDYSKVSKSYTKRVYCVQYRESDYDFIARLMEEEGIYYYWRHSATKHEMVVCDAPTAHPVGVPAELQLNTQAGSGTLGGFGAATVGHFVTKWHERVSTSGHAAVTLRDFDLVKPERPLQGKSTDKKVHPNDVVEVYNYPAGFTEESVGTALGKVQLETLRRDRQSYAGESSSEGLACGTKVSITDHPVDRLNATYLITSAYHSIQSDKYYSGADGGADQPFTVRFEAIPAATPFHMRRSTPKPVVDGLETAIITGPSGEEIYTDEYGRVKVRFHWDRGDSADEKSTCWIRVAQFGGLGNVILPRVGQEVMIDFLHGDPDRPVVMGWTFNNSLKPVYPLPANKTRAVWRTKRYGDTGQYPNAKSLDTGTPGANELRFEDKGGAEEIFIHAERDMNTRIRFEETHHVGATQHIDVGWDRTDDVGNDEITTIGKNQTLTVTGDQTETIKANRAIEVKANDTLKVGQALAVSAGTTIEMKATSSITLKCGPSSIVLDPSGITIKGPMITVDGTTMVEIKSLNTAVKGSTSVMVNGAMVMIN